MTRALILAAWAVTRKAQDVNYYFERVDLIPFAGVWRTMYEYPTPVVWLLQVPYVLGGGTRWGYIAIFMAAMLAIDASFARILWRTGGAYAGRAVVYWTLFLVCVGPTVLLRFDLITSWLIGLALLSLGTHRERLAGALTALGAAIKLWPALLWPALCMHDRRRNIRSLLVFAAVGGSLALVSLVAAGWQRLTAPLTWQSERGLQIESLLATPVMIARLFDPLAYDVRASRFQAYEVTGPGAEAMLSLATPALLVCLVVVAVIYGRWLIEKDRRLFTATMIMLFLITMMIATNKTFSPQYIVWLGGPMAAGIALAGVHEHQNSTTAAERRSLRGVGTAILALTLLTQVIYPIGYMALIHVTAFSPLVVAVLLVRNLGVLALLGWLALLAWRSIRAQVTPADEVDDEDEPDSGRPADETREPPIPDRAPEAI